MKHFTLLFFVVVCLLLCLLIDQQPIHHLTPLFIETTINLNTFFKAMKVFRQRPPSHTRERRRKLWKNFPMLKHKTLSFCLRHYEQFTFRHSLKCCDLTINSFFKHKKNMYRLYEKFILGGKQRVLCL